MRDKYDELATMAEKGQLTITPGSVRRGEAARTQARHALMEATGADSLSEAVQLARGRPPVGAKSGPSPVIRTRVPQEVKDRLTALAQLEHRAESEIIRDAVTSYVSARKVS